MKPDPISHDAHPAIARGVCVWVLGAPGLGKSTVAEALKQAFRAPILELGDLRGMHLLDPAYGDESPADTTLGFAHQCYIARSYLQHGYPCVFATDLPQAESARLPEVIAAGLPSRVLTLVIRDPKEHRRRVLGLAGPRDSGFVHVDWAARWNADELARSPYPDEHRLDTTGQTPDETIAAARVIVAGWLAAATPAASDPGPAAAGAPVRPTSGGALTAGALVDVRRLTSADDAEWRRMRGALWPHDAPDEAAADAAAWRARADAAVVVAVRAGGAGLAGFAEVGARDYADGCDTSPVAYLEGWYVDPDVRRAGVGAALVRAAEAWSRERGYAELASDALLENETSHRAHRALGFAEVERSVKYRKALTPRPADEG